MIGCVDGGIICVPLIILTSLGLGWCVKCIRVCVLRKKYGECGTCKCPCHKEKNDGKE